MWVQGHQLYNKIITQILTDANRLNGVHIPNKFKLFGSAPFLGFSYLLFDSRCGFKSGLFGFFQLEQMWWGELEGDACLENILNP